MQDTPQWVDIPTLMTMVGDQVARITVTQRCQRGTIKSYKDADGHWQVDATDPAVAAWIERAGVRERADDENKRLRSHLYGVQEENKRLREENAALKRQLEQALAQVERLQGLRNEDIAALITQTARETGRQVGIEAYRAGMAAATRRPARSVR